MTGSGVEEYIVRVRGLPWSATVEEISKFFSDCNIASQDDIHLTLSREGRPSGEAYIVLSTEEDLMKAIKKNNEHMGHRYIEVFKSKRSEMDWVIKRSSAKPDGSQADSCVRLRGLPYDCSKEDITKFFAGLEIVPNGITLPTDFQGRSTGESFVQFASKEIAEKAFGKHKEKIGHRYIEIFKNDLNERGDSIMGRPVRGGMGGGLGFGSSRPGPYDRGDRFGGGRMGSGYINKFSLRDGLRGIRGAGLYDDGFSDFDGWGRGGRRPFDAMSGGSGGEGLTGLFGGMTRGGGMGSGGFRGTRHRVHMRGLPFRANDQDIHEFFRPLIPVTVNIKYDDNGRASGECDVEFASHEDAINAMTKDKAHLQHRYIELFLNSSPNIERFGGSGPSVLMGGGNIFGDRFASGFGGMTGFGKSIIAGNNYKSF